MLPRQQDRRQNQVRELLNSASQVDQEKPRPIEGAMSIEIHFHINGPVVMGADAVGAMMPVLMQLIDSAKQRIT